MSDLDEAKVGDIVFKAESGGFTVTAIVAKVDDEGFFTALKVDGESGESWLSDPTTDPFETFAFGVWLDGSGLPVWWGDMDGDGKPELMAPVPKGDLSPTLFRVFRWTGDNLLFLRKRALLGGDDGTFHWAQVEDDMTDGVWVDSFVDGQAEVVSMHGDEVERLTCKVECSSDGFVVNKGN
jgi:hypothetical protein